MRLFVFNCLLLASVAVALPNGYHKRDLSYLKNLITSAIFGRSQINIQPTPILQQENGYKLFQLPRYNGIMKVASKKPVVKEFVNPPAVEKVNLNAFGTVVGTQSNDDTLVAVKEVDNLLSTGILYGGHNNVLKKTVVRMFPSLNTRNYVVDENINTAPVIEMRPVLTEVFETRPALTEVIETRPALTEVIETRPALTEVVKTRPALTEVVETRPALTEVVETRPALTEVVKTRPALTEVIETRPALTEVVKTRPALTEVVRPVGKQIELKVPFEQIQNYAPVMTYTAHNNPGVEVVETVKTKTDLPMYIKKRVDEAIVLREDPYRFAPVQEVYQHQSPLVVDFSYPRVETNSYVQKSFREEVAPVQEVFQYQSPTVFEFSYPRVEAKSHVINSVREEILTDGFGTVAGFGFPSQNSLEDIPVRYNCTLMKTKATNPRPIPLHSHKSLHFEEDISASNDKVDLPTGKVQPFNNLGEQVDIAQTLGPIPPQYITHVNNKGGNSKTTNVNMKQMKADSIVGSKDNVSNEKIPSNVYTFQSDPNTEKITKGSDALRTNVNTNTNQYVDAPAVNAEKDSAEIDQSNVFTNNVTSKPQSATTHPIVVTSSNVPKQGLSEYIQNSILHKPTFLKDNKNHQKENADGSSMNVNGNQHGGSVNVKENNNRGRGDIPDQ